MSEATAQKVVLASLLVSGAVIAWGNIKSSGKASPGGKQLVAFTILAAGLAIGAGVAPQIAGPLAILIAISVVLAHTAGGGSAKAAPFGTNLFGLGKKAPFGTNLFGLGKKAA